MCCCKASWKMFCRYLQLFGPYEASACVNSSQSGTRLAGLPPWLAPRCCSEQRMYLFALHQHCSSTQRPRNKSFSQMQSWFWSFNSSLMSTCSVRLWDGSQTAAAVSALRRWCRSCLSPRPGCRSLANRGSGSAWSPSSASPGRGNAEAGERSQPFWNMIH